MDTERMVHGNDGSALVVGSTSAHEILDVLEMMLKEAPSRPDLWAMRFEILRTVGLKADFRAAMAAAYRDPILRRSLEWPVISRLWQELAPGEHPPDGVVLPKADISKSGSVERTNRRFSDIAVEIADAELRQLSQEYQALRSRPGFFMDFARKTREVLRRPTPLYRAQALERELQASARIFLKREDNRQVSHATEIAVAHACIAVMLGKHFIITGNDSDEFSLALARVAPAFGLSLTVVIGLLEFDDKNELVEQLRSLRAQVEPMQSENPKTQDPREGALRRWQPMSHTYHLALSFGTGPDPYPRMISDFQMLHGYECTLQLRANQVAGQRHHLVAAVHSEADSIGFMLPYLKQADIDLFYAEPADATGRGVWRPSARLRAYNGARREHAWLRATERITHIPIGDEAARAMQAQLKECEKMAISLEDARAVALAAGLVKGESSEHDIVVLVG